MTSVTVHRPGPGAWMQLLVCEMRMVARDTAGLIVPLGLPVLILVMNASSAARQPVAHGRTALDVYVLPLVFTMVVATIGIINMPSFLAYYRRSGILRRLAVTPASPAMVLAAQVAVSVLQTAAGVAAAWVVALLVFGAQPPVDAGAALGVFALATASLYATGLIVAAVAPTPNSAVAIGLALYFLLGALGGMFGGRDSLPVVLAAIGEWLPFGAAVVSMSAAWSGSPVEAVHLLSLTASLVVGGVVAALLFRWE
ncbi:ABC-2 type transport system permease protein [Nonomuraea thailandensis]|uniref:ABC-2 type transport system permease protein n=1 Tax=Nonomuraea thailandensis TaxID=1188745 RepID=A0A9X2GFI6_9ACTN|nr:ABC transporter permease [Nonomuraea thailandensis]MCP2356539.1 ABC-2 type transport system permease protein [Nonomuraea thailandensis]